MPQINLYQALTANNNNVAPTPGGSWSYTGVGLTGAPPLPPAAPGTYDANIDFTGVAVGTYTYEYAVTDCVTIESTVTITNVQSLPVTNDVCAEARILVFPYNGGESTHNSQTLAGACPGKAAPNLSIINLPSEWTTIDVDRDKWYVATFDPTYPLVSIIACSFTVDGSPYGVDGIVEPLLAIYSDCGGPGSIIEAEVPTGGSQSINIILTDIFTTSHSFYLRVASTAANAGKFDIALTV